MTREYPVMIDGQPYTVIVSDETEALLAAKAAGKASVGLWKENQGQDLSMTRYLAESWEDLSGEYLEQVARRHVGLPWVIAETNRLRIREFKPGDESGIESESRETEADRRFRSREFLDDYIRHQYGFYGYGIWAVTEKEGGTIVGKAGIVNFTEEWENMEGGDALELGYHIFAPYRRRGYGLEACRGIVKWYSECMEYPLYAKIDASNEASIKLIEKLGFSFISQRCTGSGQWQCLYGWNC